MNPLWTLHVEDFGRIARADIALRRLTLFVGPNNSGKSYLASLLWGLVALQQELVVPDGPERTAVDSWISARVPVGIANGKLVLSDEDVARFASLFDATLRANQDKLARRVFNHDQVTLNALQFRNHDADGDISLIWADADEDLTSITLDDSLEPFAPLSTQVPKAERIERIRDLLLRRLVFRRLFRLFAPFKEGYSSIDPVYLPASRTGFMQLYKAAARETMRRAFVGEGERIELTAPAFHFLDMLAFGFRHGTRGRFVDEAEMLERALGGHFELLSGTGVHDYRYHPTGASAVLSMQLSSSVVSELGPLVMVLRHARSMPLLILEEPEAHLHPGLQRVLARVIVRLIRKGLCVWITTHSEDFCQQINNFIKLGSMPVEKRIASLKHLGYDEQEFLDLVDVTGHEVRLQEGAGASTVTEMERTPSGLVMPTFNETIYALGEEISYLDNQLEEES